MIHLKDFAAFLGLLLLVCCAPPAPGTDAQGRDSRQATPIEVKAQADRTTATLADPVVFTLSARYDPDIQVQLPEVGSQIAGMRIEDFGEEGPKTVDNQVEFKKWYKLRADIAGTYIIPSLNVGYTDKAGARQEIKTPQIFLEVKSLLTDESGERLQDLVDIKPLQQVKRDLAPFFIAGAAGIALLLLAAGGLLYLRIRKKRALELKKPAHVLALEEFEKLQQEQLVEKGIVREHFFRLSDIFRRYFENRFDIPAVEQTTQEILPELKELDGLPDSVKSLAEQFLVGSDLVKFAKYLPAANEVEDCHEQVLTVIEQTKKEEPEPPEK